MNNDLISVIIPMYNVERYIERCLRSVMNGDYRNVEILCVDDGSIDGTVTIAQKLQAEDCRIRILQHQDNRGVSAARNKSLDEAKGEYVAFIDADDWVTPDYLSTLHDIAVEKNADLVRCASRDVNSTAYNVLLHEQTEYQVFPVLERDKVRYLARNVCYCLYRRNICSLFNEEVRIGEDLLFNIRILSQNPNLRAWRCDKHIYIHCWRADSAITTAGIKRYYQVCKDIMRESDTLPVKKYAVISAVRHALAFRYRIDSHKTNAEYRKEANDLIREVAGYLLVCREISLIEKLQYLPFLCSNRLYCRYKRTYSRGCCFRKKA